MALETISQVLTSTNATYVNGVSARRKFAEATLVNLYQGLVEKDGKGVNDKFVSETDANEYSQVFVNRILPVKMKPREQGANKNGASYSQNSHYVQTTTVGIDILQIIDDTVRIPRARQDWIKTDLLAEQIKIYSDRLATIINGATAAEKLLAAWTADEYNHYEFNMSAISTNPKQILDDFIYANSKLDLGDQANGIDIFPEDSRIAVFKVSWRAPLKTSGIMQLGGANYVYDIVKGDAISHGDKARKAEDGFIGELDGVPVHLLSNESLQHASEFLGFEASDLLKSKWVGYVSSSYANARGVSTAKDTKVVDDPSGQGIILQPLTKFGVKTFYPKGNVILAETAEWNPIEALKTLFTGITGIVFKLKGAGSRLYPTVPATAFTALSASAFTFAGATALDDFNVDHLKGAYFYVGTAAATGLADYLAKASAATYKGTFTVGTSKSTTIADGEYVNVLLIADDGSITITSGKYEA